MQNARLVEKNGFEPMKRRDFRIFGAVTVPGEAGVASPWYVGRSFDSLSGGGDGLMHQNRELTHCGLQKIDKKVFQALNSGGVIFDYKTAS